jgi:hypothetical protein
MHVYIKQLYSNTLLVYSDILNYILVCHHMEKGKESLV